VNHRATGWSNQAAGSPLARHRRMSDISSTRVNAARIISALAGGRGRGRGCSSRLRSWAGWGARARDAPGARRRDRTRSCRVERAVQGHSRALRTALGEEPSEVDRQRQPAQWCGARHRALVGWRAVLSGKRTPLAASLRGRRQTGPGAAGAGEDGKVGFGPGTFVKRAANRSTKARRPTQHGRSPGQGRRRPSSIARRWQRGLTSASASR